MSDVLRLENVSDAELQEFESDLVRLRELIDGIDAIIWEAGPDGRIRFISRRAEEILGYPAERGSARPGFWLDIVHPDDREWAGCHRRRLPRRRPRRRAGISGDRGDGRVIWFRESVRVDPRRHGRVGRSGARCGTSPAEEGRAAAPRRTRELAEQLEDMSYLHELSRRLWGEPTESRCSGRSSRRPRRSRGPRWAWCGSATRRGASWDGGQRRPPDGVPERFGRVPVGDAACGRRRTRRAGRHRGRRGRAGHAPFRDGRRRGLRGEYSTPLVSRRRHPGDDRDLLPRAAPPARAAGPPGRAVRPPGRRLRRERQLALQDPGKPKSPRILP